MSSSWLRAAINMLWLASLARLLWVLTGYYILEGAERHHLETAWMIFSAVSMAAVAVMPSAAGTTSRQSAVAPATIAAWIAASVLLFYQSLFVGLLSDDFVLLALSPLGTDWQFFRPLPLAAWKIVYPLTGPIGLHVINATLHGINAFLVYRLTAALLPHAPRIQCVAAATVFLTFPGAVEPVTWAAGIFDVALVTAGLTYLNVLLRNAGGVSITALAALAAALLCKETAVALPVIAWSLRRVAPVHLGTLAWSTAMVGTFAVTRMIFTDAPEVNAPLGYFLKEMVSRPFATLGTPFTSVELAQAPIVFGVVPQVVIAALVTGYLFQVRHGLRPLLPASWILMGVAPLLTYFFISDTLQGSRYLYLPLVGWSILIAQLADGGDHRYLKVSGLLLVSIIVSYGAAGIVRHQAAWVAAAGMRDAVLLEARRAAAGCETATFADVPDHEQGAYVFRNGFVQAAGQSGVRVVTSDAAPAGCAFVWRDGSFVAASSSLNPRTQ